MNIKDVIAEDFINYKLPSMFIVTSVCDWKCCTEVGMDIGVCQNAPLASQPTQDVSIQDIYELYRSNDITKAVVIGGLEPFMQTDEVLELIRYFRSEGEECPFVIYTGYYPNEIKEELDALGELGNIIVKFGRYIPDRPPVYDVILGVTLSSNNQFAREINGRPKYASLSESGCRVCGGDNGGLEGQRRILSVSVGEDA